MAGFTAVALFTGAVLTCSVDVTRGVSIYTYRQGQPEALFLKPYLNKRYTQVESDVDSLKAILKILGVDETLMKVWLEENPTVQLTFDGKMYTFSKTYGPETLTHRFALGFKVLGPSWIGRTKTTVFDKVGKDVLRETTQIDDKTLVLTWTFREDVLYLTTELDKIVAKATFKPTF